MLGEADSRRKVEEDAHLAAALGILGSATKNAAHPDSFSRALEPALGVPDFILLGSPLGGHQAF